MKLLKVRKRSGLCVPYDRQKIFNAIAGANRDASSPVDKLSDDDLQRVTDSVENSIARENGVDVEKIQDTVEEKLMAHGFFDVAKKFILYRQKHAQRRAAQKKLIETYRDIFFADAADIDLKRDNANINTDASMGIMLKLGAESSKYFLDNYVLPEEFVEADRDNWIHIHDKDFSLITLNCCQIDLLKLFRGGFSTGHGFLREPNSIRSYASLACIAIQSNQNDMFGGQSINAFDYAMAEGVRKSFRKALQNEIHRACEFGCVKSSGEIDFDICSYSEKENPAAVKNLAVLVGRFWAEKIYKLACADVEEETHQAMEALIHNFNTLHSRAGAQVPFSSINYGMDTSPEGRLVIREVLNAIDAGLGNGETPIFPISVFQLKSGVNYNVDDPNYDLFRQACKVSAKRLFPNFVNLDAPYNLQYYKPGDYNSYVATMGCADGDEIVAYRYGGRFFCEGLKRLWERLTEPINERGISEYVQPKDLQVWDADAGKFVGVYTVIKNPDQNNWVRVTFSHGRSILVTADHPLYTQNRGRVLVADLKIGDQINSYYKLPNVDVDAQSSIFDTDEAYVLGLILTDGCYDGGLSVTLDAKTESDILKTFINRVKKTWGKECSVTHYERGGKGDYFMVRVKGSPKAYCDIFSKVFGGLQKKFRNIPTEVFTAPREMKLAFLAGMIDGDGHVSPKSKIQIGSTNKELAWQQLALVQSLGYPAKLYLNHYNPTHFEKIRYRVEFSMSKEIARHLASEKKARVQWNGNEPQTLTPKTISVRSIEYLGRLNKCSYDLETTTDKFTLSFINSGNCRTRVMSNVNGREESGSRGNFAFVTINLPKLAIESHGDVQKFFVLFDKYITLCHDYLLHRLKTIEEKHAYNFPFLMGQGVWMDSDKLKPNDKIKDVLKHASYSIGFCGLAECLVALIGKHHGQSDDAQQLGLKIIGHLRERTDEFTRQEKRNWTTFATPAESTAGQFQRANQKLYGKIKGVTDRPYMTNSNHVPVYFPICASEKIRIEAPYHALCNAGHIAYIEMDGDPTKNLSAFEALVRAMHDADMGYFSINHPVDRDPVCGFTGIIDNECPRCHRKEFETGTFHIERLKPKDK